MAYSRDLGRTNGSVYDDDNVGDTVKSNTAVEDAEWGPAEMRNDGDGS